MTLRSVGFGEVSCCQLDLSGIEIEANWALWGQHCCAGSKVWYLLESETQNRIDINTDLGVEFRLPISDTAIPIEPNHCTQNSVTYLQRGLGVRHARHVNFWAHRDP